MKTTLCFLLQTFFTVTATLSGYVMLEHDNWVGFLISGFIGVIFSVTFHELAIAYARNDGQESMKIKRLR